ncbi:glycosyl transferase family protein [Roseibium sp. TrichSKD4]|nr:glycosyl transferase family protein [Roseibium sp. TrichSKD4]
MTSRVGIIIPLFNESDVLPLLAERLYKAIFAFLALGELELEQHLSLSAICLWTCLALNRILLMVMNIAMPIRACRKR